jgi:hypothetical protein
MQLLKNVFAFDFNIFAIQSSWFVRTQVLTVKTLRNQV